MSSTTTANEIAGLVASARRSLNSRKADEAIGIANDLVRRFAAAPDGWALLSEVNLRLGKIPLATQNIKRAIERRPDDAANVAQLARCYTLLQQKHEALDTAKRAAALRPKDAQTLDAVAAILSLCDEQELALPLAEQAVELAPDNSGYLYNLAAMQRMAAQIELAEKNCDRVIELNPGDYRAYYTRSDLRRQSRENNHVAEMESLLDRDIREWRGELLICFALAKECADLEEHEKSFSYLQRACNLQRAHTDYDVDDDIRTIDKVISLHTREAFTAARVGATSEEPIFVVGLPRTGTTLVERIIGSHSQVFAAGELQDFAAVLVKAVQGTGGRQRLSKENLVKKSLEIDFSALGVAYIESTRPRTGRTPRFIDKLPLNYLYCGLIHAALPNAKIIGLNRNPMDACFAVYRMMFNSAYPFAYDLDDLGKYYVAWRRLMEHWKNELGDALMVVDYEDIVENQERVSRELIEFCGLDWEAACLDFHKNTSASSTASAVQVRQPVYQTSIDRWRHYERQLQPLAEVLRRNGIQVS